MNIAPENQPILCPFTIAIDDREKLPYQFATMRADAALQYRPFRITTAVRHLHAGDYSIEGYERHISIERKSKEDLFGTLGSHRARFERELERLADYDYAEVMIEATLSEIMRNPPTRSELNPRTVIRSIIAWRQRYGVHFSLVEGREVAEAMTFRVLERFWKDRQKLEKVAARMSEVESTEKARPE